MKDKQAKKLYAEIEKLRAAVERLAGPAPAVNDWAAADCFVWVPARQHLQPVARPNRVDIALTTHSDGGITRKDLDLAKSIDEIAG